MFSHERKIKNKQKGFTLIELLVVIAIIGMMAAIFMYAVSMARARARDARRKADVNTFQKAMDIYLQEPSNGYYPPTAGPPFSPSPTTLDDTTLGNALKPYLPIMPRDPSCAVGSSGCTYQLQTNSNTLPTEYAIQIIFETIPTCKRMSAGANAATYFPAVPVCSY